MISIGIVIPFLIVSRMMDVTIPAEYQFIPFGRY